MNSEEQLTTIKLSGQLGKRFGRVHRFYVSSPGEAIRALSTQIEGFAAYVADGERNRVYRIFVADHAIDPEEEIHKRTNTKEIRISPVVQGAKRGGLFNIILGAAMIALAFYTGGASMASWGTLSNTMFAMGVSLALGGVAQLLSPQPQLGISDGPENTPNKNLDGPVNTIASGRPIPIAYGEVVVGSATVSAGIFSSDITVGEPEQDEEPEAPAPDPEPEPDPEPDPGGGYDY